MTSRRGFIGALLGAAVLDPERLLWVPGKRMISIPKPAISSILQAFVYHIDVYSYKMAQEFWQSPDLSWVKNTYSESGWNATTRILKSTEINKYASLNTIEVTLTQQQDPFIYQQTGGNFYPPRNTPSAIKWWADHPRYNRKPLGG